MESNTWGAWLAQSWGDVALDLRDIGLSPRLSIEITQKKNKQKKVTQPRKIPQRR